MKTKKYQLLANKWKKQADESKDEFEQAWLYACAADLDLLNIKGKNRFWDIFWSVTTISCVVLIIVWACL